jgi:hypothetical protein
MVLKEFEKLRFLLFFIFIYKIFYLYCRNDKVSLETQKKLELQEEKNKFEVLLSHVILSFFFL